MQKILTDRSLSQLATVVWCSHQEVYKCVSAKAYILVNACGLFPEA